MAELTVCKISIPNTARDYFDYYAGDHDPCLGARVLVPFRNTLRMGMVVGKALSTDSHKSTLSIASCLDNAPIMTGELLALAFWVSDYYQSPLSQVIPLILPKKYRTGDPETLPLSHHYTLAMPPEAARDCVKKTATRQLELIDFLSKTNRPLSKEQLHQAGFTQTILQPLLAKSILLRQTERKRPEASLRLPKASLSLNPLQTVAVHTIGLHLDAYHAFLLHGVTGSGKTEIYLQIIARVLAAGKQVLVLVPEIGLTPQLLMRFQERFTEPMVVIHSGLNDTERQLAWIWAKEESVKLVIGTRSAIFTPMPALGLIVIDEEHDSSLKQMDGVRYSARDTALMRAHLRHIPIILGSATPSLESLHNCTVNKYTLLTLTEKAESSNPVCFQIVDLRNQPLQHGLAAPTLALIKEHLQQHHQVLVFINRRGFSPVVLCHHCGWIADCRACDAHLTFHKTQGQLLCHHCGLTQVAPTQCPHCQSRELIPVGTGTQRVHDYLQEQFPSTSMIRIDRDEIRQKKALHNALERIHAGEAQLIIGTQLMAKGHHFPRLTLVVILDIDNGFYNQDFRALERLGQLVTQVAGRAGRAALKGHIVIQTHVPHHPMLISLIQDGYDLFAQRLLKARLDACLPPYHFLAVIRSEGRTAARVLQFLHTIKKYLSTHQIQVLGPAPAPLARKAALFRMQLLIKSSSRQHLKITLTQMRTWLAHQKSPNGVHWAIDVDPQDLA